LDDTQVHTNMRRNIIYLYTKTERERERKNAECAPRNELCNCWQRQEMRGWWLWSLLLVCLCLLPLSNSIQQDEAFVPIGPLREKDEHATQPSQPVVKPHGSKHWKPLQCTPNKEKAEALIQKAQNSLSALFSNRLFKHIDVESCQEFRVVEIKVGVVALSSII
jgi:hypothetical protein